MNNRIQILLLSLMAVFAAGATEMERYCLNVENFKNLTVVDGINVDYKASVDSAGMAVFWCEPRMASKLMFTNTKERLSIQTAADETPLKNLPKVTVYSTVLEDVENSGDSTLRLLTTVPVETIKIREIGNGRIEALGIEANEIEASVDTGRGTVVVAGTARKGKLRNVGTGTLDASGLELQDGRIFVFGSGPVFCNIVNHLTVHGIGPGKIVSDRQPAKITRRSLGVKVEITDPEASEAQPEAQ